MIHKRTQKEYLEKAEVKPDRKNFIATNHLATKPILWKVASNARSRKINACAKGILHIVNILLLYKHYVCVIPYQVHIKALQLNVQQNNNLQNPGINPLIEIKEPGVDYTRYLHFKLNLKAQHTSHWVPQHYGLYIKLLILI